MKPLSIYAIIAFRVVTIMLVLLFSALIISGRRTIGQLPVYDMLTIIVIGAITGADIAEPDTPHMHIIFAIIATFLFQRLINILYLKSKLMRKYTSFPPMVLIQDGKMVYKNIKAVRYTVDEVLMLLRQNDVFHIHQVRYAILEPNGELSILRHSENQFATKGDVQAPITKVEPSYTIILDGNIDYNNLNKLNLTESHILSLLNKQGYKDIKSIFYASIHESTLIVSPYNYKSNIL